MAYTLNLQGWAINLWLIFFIIKLLTGGVEVPN